MKRLVPDIEEWHALDATVRDLVQRYFSAEGETARILGRDELGDEYVQHRGDLAAAAAHSPARLIKELYVGNLDRYDDIAYDLWEESPHFQTPAQLIDHAMHVTRIELRHHAASLRRSTSLIEYEERQSAFWPKDVRLVIDHAMYALYVAWQPGSRIIIPDNRPELLRSLVMDESMYRVIEPRRFEELVAYLYECLGCRVHLTPPTRDFGADILAWHGGPFNSESLIAVQVKRYAPHRKVGLKGLFELHGAVAHYQADAGHLVTTSSFTESARLFAARQKLHTVDMKGFRIEVDRLFG